MPLVTPCTSPHKRENQDPRLSADQRRLGWHFGDVQEAGTILRTAGVWTQMKVPTTNQILAADVVLQGGHVYDIDAALITEIQAAGLCVSIFAAAAGVQYATEAGDEFITEAGDLLVLEAV